MPNRRSIEIRCPIYGFIPLDEWEREIISQPAFQRLRRIRQLAWTDYVYPGAMHTRFEHSIGVMHMATLLYDGIASRCGEVLREVLGYDDSGVRRYRQIIRLAALLHDIGHGPFSHAAEELTPSKETSGKPRAWKHEEYSAWIIRTCFRDVIENHKANSNYAITADEVAGLIEGGTAAKRAAVWRVLVSGQLDADRMDYLLRDSYHAGVEYVRYDWRRIVGTVTVIQDGDTDRLRVGLLESGRHAGESLLIARYMMFNQVYFHKTRVILDHHFHEAMRTMLPNGHFPPPTTEDGIKEYLRWDDWLVLGRLAAGEGGEHGECLRTRNFCRLVKETDEFPDDAAMTEFENAVQALDHLSPVRLEAKKSWYKTGDDDLQIASEDGSGDVRALSSLSTIVGTMKETRRVRLYVRPEHREKARRLLEKGRGTER
ncbi:MAG: metal dependent phosphohydrolase [Rhodospirillaceae bacterium]|nr:MAG: metal dependent phosphohydrolase [Rhodospirillaceae bacterium]